jgi:Mn2+/Fe2+ NRAMP family transporter
MTVSLRQVGPGIVIAATGLGAGDLIAAAVAGARYDYALLWAALLGAILKFALNEGLARWQLNTGTTLIEGWRQRLPAVVSWYFLAYLLVWTFVVAAALMAACGLAAHALFPSLGVTEAAIGHSLLALVFVWQGRYRWLEQVMKVFIVLMFIVVLVCAWQIFPGWSEILKGLLVPEVPPDSTWFLLGVVGGVGGSVTLLSYGYWIRERGWIKPDRLPQVRLDLFVAYAMTAVFAIAVMLISAGVQPEVMKGSEMVLSVAQHLGSVVGDTGQTFFLIGFWAAVFSSMLGVWQGVPYLFCDFIQAGKQQAVRQPIDTSCLTYRGYLLFMAVIPMALVNFAKPVWLVVLYAVVGAMFMPLLAVLLLYMNNRHAWIGKAANGLWANAALCVALILFVVLLVQKTQTSLFQI